NNITKIITYLSNEVSIFNETYISILPIIGTVSPHALKKGKKIRLDKKEYLSIPYQFISFMVGLIDGDGYIQVTKTTKGFITIKLVICLSLEDISTLEYIHSVLKLGKITIYRDIKNPICKLIINKTDLQEIVFPLLIHHNIFFLTNSRRAQFDLAMFLFKNNLKLYDQIGDLKEIPTIFKLPTIASDYLKLEFFFNWLIGFTNAEGSFFIKKNNDGCYQLKQRIHVQLFEAFKLLFNTKKKISIALAPAQAWSGAGQGEKNKYLQFSVSSKTDIQKVIHFFSFSGLHPLIGLKSIQYFKWLNNLQKSCRYKNLHYPK
uniref:LAGLIDADG homing endonuclease n=1 Tax=Pappia fissilis TaxID=1040649 RepID=UPI002A80FD8E